MEKPIVLGADIGGSHITAALIDLETGTIIRDSIARMAVDSRENATIILNAWCEVINKVFNKSVKTEKYIGIAMPGPFDYENGISLIKDQDKFNALYLVNLKEELAKRLNIRPSVIRFINDAAGFMQGEVFGGAAKGYKCALGLTLGTGLGSAIAVNGVAKDVALWNSGFLNGIAENYLSTGWFVDNYKKLSGGTINGVKELAAVAATDELAKRLFNEFGSNLADFLVPIIQENGVEIIILGGNIAQAFEWFSASLINRLAFYNLNTVIKISKLNEQATLIGAASEWNLISK